MRALVIDDEPAVRELVAEMLQSLGFQPDAVASGDEGLARLERQRYDLLVTDLAMPRMTGWEVVTAVRERGLELGVVLASGSIGNLDATRARELRAMLLTKPFQLAELRQAVEAVLPRVARLARHEAGPGWSPASAGHDPAPPAHVPDLAASVGRVIDTMRRASQDVQALFGAMEAMLADRERAESRQAALEAEHAALQRSHRVLAGAHESVTTALAELREVHAALMRRQEGAVQALEGVRERLDGCIRDLRA